MSNCHCDECTIGKRDEPTIEELQEQLTEANTRAEKLDAIASELQDTCHMQAKKLAKAEAELAMAKEQIVGRWEHCSPELLAAGIDCAETPRRPCECGQDGSHDHFIQPSMQELQQELAENVGAATNPRYLLWQVYHGGNPNMRLWDYTVWNSQRWTEFCAEEKRNRHMLSAQDHADYDAWLRQWVRREISTWPFPTPMKK